MMIDGRGDEHRRSSARCLTLLVPQVRQAQHRDTIGASRDGEYEGGRRRVGEKAVELGGVDGTVRHDQQPTRCLSERAFDFTSAVAVGCLVSSSVKSAQSFWPSCSSDMASFRILFGTFALA